MDEAAGFEMPLVQHGDARIVGFCRFAGFCFFEVVEDLELHDGAGQLLGQPVMNFISYQLPFMIAGLEQVFEGPVLFLQRLLGLFILGNVVEKGEDMIDFSILGAEAFGKNG